MPSSTLGSIGGAVAGKIITGKGKKSSKPGFVIPKNITTGFSSFNTQTGKINIDPSIREGQDTFLENIGNFRGDINESFDRFDTGLEGLGEGVQSLRDQFTGNQSAFRELSLNPIRQSIASRKGALERELGRTEVRGSFANQARDTLSLAAGRELSDAEAKVENERINRLGDFLGMDAEILKQSLTSDTGRINLLKSIEEAAFKVSGIRFDQERSLLGLPGNLAAGKAAEQRAIQNAEGLDTQAGLNLAGEIFKGLGGLEFGGLGGGSGAPDDFGVVAR